MIQQRKNITRRTTSGHTDMTPVAPIHIQHARTKIRTQKGSNRFQPNGGITGEQGA